MLKIMIMIIVSVLVLNCKANMFCNYFPLNPKACIRETDGIMCQFSLFENACIAVDQTIYGCVNNLNKKACLYQLSTQARLEAKCYFRSKCIAARPSHLKNLGCSPNFSKYACTNVQNKNCIWENNLCSEYSTIPKTASSCGLVYNNPVTSSLCSFIPQVRCMSGGYQGNYECTDVTDADLFTLQCTQPGLNELGCVLILTTNQKCIFKDNICQSFIASKSDSCDLKVNKWACLSLSGGSTVCQWTKRGCEIYEIPPETQCEDLVNVNSKACKAIGGLCVYDPINKSCIKPKTNQKITCDTEGISEETCMSLDMPCTYFYNSCQSIQSVDYDQYKCEMKLNKKACVNMTGRYQFCQWDGSKCNSILINQDTDCASLLNVNGNVCQYVIKSVCMYDTTNYKCISSKANDSCSSSYINLLGCVSILKSNYVCQWTSTGCKSINIVKYQTKCSSLGFANPIACSLILEDKLGCYFSDQTKQCTEFKLDSSIGCKTLGLNQNGCSYVTKEDEICRWYRGGCVKIANKVDVRQINCISLQSVNAAACALIEANSEPCKFNSLVNSCVSSVDGKKDACDTPGLNSHGCAKITNNGMSCIYDTVKWKCKSLNLGEETPSLETINLLATATCTGNSPTILVCASITNYLQQCAWSDRLQKCVAQYVALNKTCLDFNQIYMDKQIPGTKITVNANVCAAVEMNFPDHDQSDITKDKNRGYCSYDKGTHNCIVIDTLNCTNDNKCCTTNLGINAHSCSRFSDKNTFCYFNKNQRCTELTASEVDITSQTLVANFFNSNRYPCSSVNILACHLIEWATTQWCYHNGTSCVNINFSDYPDLSVFTKDNITTNRYTCMAIEAVSKVETSPMYFSYDEAKMNCKVFESGISLTCSETNINLNACTKLTVDDYCMWDRITLQCSFIEDIKTIQSCTALVNQKTCQELNDYPCLFLNSTDKCKVATDGEIDCTEYDDLGTVSSKACSIITKDGTSCRYDSNTHLCVVHNQNVSTCNVSGANSIACYNYTQANCRWNPDTLICYQISDDSEINTLGCEDYVNKFICLKLTKEPCEWDPLKMKCLKVTDFSNTTYDAKSSNLSNAQTCTQLVGASYIYNVNKNRCVSPPSNSINCNSYPMNAQSCLTNTRNYMCYFDNTKGPSEKCSTFTDTQVGCQGTLMINLEVCSRIQATCVYDPATWQCKTAIVDNTTKCSSMKGGSSFYNIYSCASISQANISLQAAQICIDVKDTQSCSFEKYCFWDPATYTCDVLVIGVNDDTPKEVIEPKTCTDSEGTDYNCDETVKVPNCVPIKKTYNICKNTYSKAVCLEVVSASCFFDLAQGGCNDINSKEKTVPTCSNANYLSCLKVTNPLAQCTKSSITDDFTPGCNMEMATQVCTTYSGIGVSCSTLGATINSSVCATATDACYFNGSSCSSSVTSTSCDTLGLSSTSCTNLGVKCKFENNLCQYASDPVIPSTCDGVNSSSEDDGRKPSICSKVADKCKYSSGSTCTQLTDPISCSSLGTDYVTIEACLACTGGTYQYANSKCSEVTQTTYQCLNLNKEACVSKTDLVYCIWKDNICQEAGIIVIYSMTDCALVNLVSCSYVNNDCWQKGGSCISSESNTNCTDISKDLGNTLACSRSTKENCFWNGTTNACDKVGSDTYGCTQEGLNINSCLENTFDDTNSDLFYKCYYNGSTCSLFNSSINSDQECANLNKYACLSITGKMCGWKNSEKRCKAVTLSNIDCVSYSNQNVDFCNALTCSSIVNLQCYQNNSKCAAVDADKSCTEPGLNRLGCLQRTKGNCQFKDMNCQIMNDSSLGCLDTLNKYACVNQVAQCKFDQTCQSYDNSVIPVKATALSILTTGVIQYSPQVCATLTIAITYLAYDTTTYMCKNVEADISQTCGALGINKLACLEKTKQLCKYDSGSCQLMTRTQVMSLKTCDSTLNWYSCITQTVLGGCKFMNGLCQPIVQSTDNCQALITQQSKVKQSICSIQTDGVCLYNPKENLCETSASTSLACTTPGLNKIGCLNNTEMDICLFDTTKSTCQIYVKNDVSCESQINSLKCYYVGTENNFCYFNAGACKAIPLNELTTCVKAYRNNPATCSQAIDVACFYDQNTYKCTNGPPTTECSGNVSVNQKGCIVCSATDTKLKWNNGCNQITDGELELATCSDPLNKFACANISNPSQFCQFKSDSCQSVDYTTIGGNCTTRTHVNRQEYCEAATDVSCWFNTITRNCEERLTNVEGCPRGLNEKACLTYGSYNSGGANSCKFQNFCFSPDQVVFCDQATNQEDCLNITTDSCEYAESQCKFIDTTTLKCTDLADTVRQFSEMACNKSQLDNALNVCVQDSDTKQCKSIQPTSCDEIKDQVSCTNIQGIPCLWANKLCTFHLADPMVDTCASVNKFGSQRACLDIKRVGYYCYFNDFKCITVPTTVKSCDPNMNYVACLIQQNYACQWKIEESIVKTAIGSDDYIYLKGICGDYEEKGEQGCSDNLSLISCMMVTKPGAQCIWLDHKCQQITQIPSVVTQRTYSIINQNACGLVTNGSVEYNPIIYGCKQASDTRNCITPGLNREACITIKSYKCLWNSELKQCQNYKSTRRILAGDQCHVNSETVNEQICQQISLYVPCGYDGGNCAALNSSAQCEDDGVNFYGCMTITTGPCIWVVDHCEEYYPFGTCNEVPELVNSLVCANVDEDACQFDGVYFQCVPLDNQTGCNISGLNSIGCAQKDGCIFLNEKCQLPEGNIACSTAISANQNVCAQAIDRCKYNDLSYGCTQSTVIDSCFTPGLSALGCNVLEKCTMSNDGCQCLAYVQRFPTCTDVFEYSICTSLPYCYFELTKVNSTKDLTEFLKNSNAGLCRNKVCSDFLITQCDGQFIDKTLCYLNKDYKCVSANTCNEIIQPLSECFTYKLQSRLCVSIPNQCTTLDCRSLGAQFCANQYKEYCVYDNNNCSERTCDQMSKEQCLANTCDYDETTEKCSNQISCSLVTNSTKCIGKKEINRQCGWITLDDQQQICSVNGCRYMGKAQGTCIGTHIGDEVCVQLSDFSCVACEEITDACVCFEHQSFCTYDRLQAKCVSLSCNSYTKDSCPSTCRYSDEMNVCLTKCEANYNQEICASSTNCKWDTSNQLCIYSEPVTIVEKIILPTPTNGILLTIGLMVIINL